MVTVRPRAEERTFYIIIDTVEIKPAPFLRYRFRISDEKGLVEVPSPPDVVVPSLLSSRYTHTHTVENNPDYTRKEAHLSRAKAGVVRGKGKIVCAFNAGSP